MRRLQSLLIVAGLALAPSTALAQRAMRDLPSTERGPTSELYIRKRPPTPEAPVLNEELKKLLNTKEKARDDKRLEAIGLLRGFLATKPVAETRAEGTFKLAELLWEESRRLFLIKMDEFGREVEKCSNTKAECTVPKEPRIDLKEAASLYQILHDEFPQFRRIDLVTYLIGFAAKEDGREDEAMGRFQEVIDKYPDSALFGDSWMMIGEHYFAAGDWAKARDAYKNVGDGAATSDLATFKVAWCEWKLGDSLQAAKDFKAVLDKAVEAEKNGTASQRQRSANLKEEALEYLVVVFTEDRTISPKEVFDFLVSINGEQYSRDVMVKVAESYAAQAEWDRSTDAYRFLIRMDPEALKSAEYQRSIIANWTSALDIDRAQEEIKVLLDNFGPDTAWAKAQRNREALTKSLATTEELVRSTAKGMHGEAQRREKADKKPDINAYTRAANAYEQYLSAFGGGKNPSPHAVEIRFYRAEILYYRLGKPEEAGDEKHLAVGKTSPVGEFHKDALYNAIEAFKKARPEDTQGRTKFYPVDKKFGEALDLYATLFPADKRIVGVIFKNGQMFYDYGEYDEAIKRFGVIVTKYPDDENAGPAGDRILGALNKAEDYENIENWARKLKNAKAFAAPDQQARLDRLIVESIQKSGDKYAAAGRFEQAAGFYMRIPKETKDPKVAAQAMMNAGVMYEKSKDPEKAADIYLDIANTFGEKNPDIAEKAAFTAGQVYEKVIFYDKAASAYELVWNKIRTGSRSADALFNAGLLRQALGQNKEAIAHYQEYTKKFRERKDAPDVAFNIGVVLESSGDEGAAHKAYEDYARTYRSTNKRIVEAYTRAGRMSYKAGKYKDAKEELAQSQKIWKLLSGDAKKTATPWAAEARYYEAELVFRDYEKVTLDVPPKQLEKALKAKGKLLGDAEKIYTSVVDYGDLKWATAALFRIGQVYDGFAESLVNASTPKGLSADQAQAYRDVLDVYVVEIQDKAVAAFGTAYNKAIQMQVYDEYTAKIREALGRLAADKYPPERESREKVRIGDRPPAQPLVTEVAVGRRPAMAAAVALAACGGASATGSIKPGQKQHVKLDPVDPKAMIDFEAAMRAMRLKGPEAAETAKGRLKDALGKDKNLWEAWHDLGIIALREGDDQVAIDAFDHALAINKDHNESLLARAEAYRHAGNKKSARADYEAALRSSDEDDPIRRDAAARLASLLRDFGDYDDAVAVLRDTIRLSGINAKIYTELGLIYILQERLDLAQLVLNKAVDLDEAAFKAADDGKGKRDPGIYNALALLAMKQGKAQEAFQRFDQAVQLDANYVDARFSKATVLLDAGDYDRAKAELAIVVDKRPDDYAAQVSMGVAQRGLKDLAGAKKTWDKVIKEAPKKSDARADAMWNEFVLALDFQNDTANAKVALERYMQEAPSNHAKRPAAEEKRKELKL